MATKGVNPFAKSAAPKGIPAKGGPTPKAPAGKAPGMTAPGAKVNPFATKTSGPAFKKGGKC
jgi:hypothetical protein